MSGVPGAPHPSGYSAPRLRDAWEHGRRTAERGGDVGECPHDPRPGLDPEAAARIAWFEGHADRRHPIVGVTGEPPREADVRDGRVQRYDEARR